MRILGISGSLRVDSYNSRLLEAAREVLPGDVELVVWRGLKEVPPYDYDDEAAGIVAPAVAELRRAIEDADAVLIATPEYNHSIPGVLKNALDWVSRPAGQSVLKFKPAAVVGASTGMFGAVWGQAETRKVVSALGARVVDAELPVPHAHEDGTFEDPEFRSALAGIVAALARDARPVAVAA